MRRAALCAALAAALSPALPGPSLPGSALPGSALPGSGAAVLSLVFDGVAHDFAPRMEGARTGFSRFAALDALSIEGEDGPARLVLEFALPTDARPGDSPLDARISFRPDGWREYWVSLPLFPAGAVTIEHLDLSGPAPRIAGRAVLSLCLAASPLHPPDPARCAPAILRFDTAVLPD